LAGTGATGSQEPTDAALVQAAKAGEHGAFEQLLDRHEPRVLRVLRLLGVQAADREDVAQDVFVRIFRGLRGYRPGHDFGGWVYRISVNAAHDHRRRRHRLRQSEVSLGETPDESPALTSHPADPGDRLDRRRALERALGSLTERERAVFVLCELEGLSSKHVAQALGISSITVRRHLGRAKNRLQGLLAMVLE